MGIKRPRMLKIGIVGSDHGARYPSALSASCDKQLVRVRATGVSQTFGQGAWQWQQKNEATDTRCLYTSACH